MRDAFEKKKLIKSELAVDFGCGQVPVFGQVYPLRIEGQDVAAMLFHPVDTFRAMESMLFERNIKTPMDSRWILNEHYQTIQFKADSGSIFYGREPGFSLFEAVAEEHHAKVQEIFDQAVETPRQMMTFTIEATRKHGLTMLEADVVYMPDMLYGDRYFVMTRPEEDRRPNILNRMQDAWQVRTDVELAEKLETTPSTVSEVRRGHRDMPDKWVVKTLLKCRVHFIWLWFGVGDMDVPDDF